MFRRTANTGLSTPITERSRVLAQALATAAAEGLDVIEIRQHQGRGGMLPVGDLRWEDDGEGANVEDEDDEPLLIGGMPPAELAEEICRAATDYVAELGEAPNLRVVGLRYVEDGTEEVFSLPLPKSLWAEFDPPRAREDDGAFQAANAQLMRHNDALMRNLLAVVNGYPTVMAKVAELLEQLGDQLNGGRQQDLAVVMQMLDHERTRENAWMAHDATTRRSDHRAEMATKAIEFAGPALMELIAELARRMGLGDQPAAAEDEPTQRKTKNTKDTPKGSALASELQAALDLPDDKIEALRKVLSTDEWKLIDAARQATTDDEFRSLFLKLADLWAARPKDETSKITGDLTMILGPKGTMTITNLIRKARQS